MTQEGRKPWCFWQSECSDYDGFACMASSSAGHVFECTFDEHGEFIDSGIINGEPWLRPIHPTGGGACEDCRLLKNIKE